MAREEEDEAEARSLGIDLEALRRRVSEPPCLPWGWEEVVVQVQRPEQLLSAHEYVTLFITLIRWGKIYVSSETIPVTKICEGLSWGRGINLSVIPGEVGGSSGEGRQRREAG